MREALPATASLLGTEWDETRDLVITHGFPVDKENCSDSFNHTYGEM